MSWDRTCGNENCSNEKLGHLLDPICGECKATIREWLER